MNTPRRRSLALAAALLALPATGLVAQQPPNPAPVRQDQGQGQDGEPGTEAVSDHRVVASVNGTPITSSDVAYSMRIMTARNTGEAELEATIVRRMSEQILLATEADRLGLTLSRAQVNDYFEQRFGRVPDYEVSAETAGTTIQQQRELAKRVVLSELYLMNRVGMRADPGVRIDPDLALSRLVKVTPRQLREYFQEFREQLDLPPSVTYAIYPCADESAAHRLVAARRVGDDPPNDERAIRETAPLDMLGEVFFYAPETAEFVRNGVLGAVSEPLIIEEGDQKVILVVEVLERAEAKAAVFEEVQEELKNRIQADLLIQARMTLVRDLARQAVFWPSDLFDAR